MGNYIKNKSKKNKEITIILNHNRKMYISKIEFNQINDDKHCSGSSEFDKGTASTEQWWFDLVGDEKNMTDWWKIYFDQLHAYIGGLLILCWLFRCFFPRLKYNLLIFQVMLRLAPIIFPFCNPSPEQGGQRRRRRIQRETFLMSLLAVMKGKASNSNDHFQPFCYSSTFPFYYQSSNDVSKHCLRLKCKRK